MLSSKSVYKGRGAGQKYPQFCLRGTWFDLNTVFGGKIIIVNFVNRIYAGHHYSKTEVFKLITTNPKLKIKFSEANLKLFYT